MKRLTDEQIKTYKKNGLSYYNVYGRLKNNWNVEEAITLRNGESRSNLKILGKELTNEQVDMLNESGLSYSVIHRRLKAGWSMDRAVSEPPQERTTNKDDMTVSEQMKILGRMKYLNRAKDDTYNPVELMRKLGVTWEDVTEIPVEIENRYVKDEFGWNRVNRVSKHN